MSARFNHLTFFYIFLLFLAGPCNPAYSQGFQSIKQAEDTLATILIAINNAGDDIVKNALNDSFYHCLSDALMLQAADDYPFESLKTLAKITSDDHKFRIFHWNLPTKEGKNRYFGFLKILNREHPRLYILTDFTDSIPTAETIILDNHHWFGALYYKIIPGETAHGQKFYTLLGWAGKNSEITQKVIEILTFNEEDRPQFGLKVFPDFMGGKMTRIIFRYAASTTMSLKYEEQVISSEKKWNKTKRVFESRTKTARMIVCDRLVPRDPQLEGMYQYYIPDGEICDGFLMEHGCWNFIKSLVPRNKQQHP